MQKNRIKHPLRSLAVLGHFEHLREQIAQVRSVLRIRRLEAVQGHLARGGGYHGLRGIIVGAKVRDPEVDEGGFLVSGSDIRALPAGDDSAAPAQIVENTLTTAACFEGLVAGDGHDKLGGR